MTKSIFRSSIRGLFIGIAILFFGLSASAQSEYDAHLVGHVIDEKTGEHLPYVNIQIKGTNIGTVTDESGHYFLKNLTPGRVTVVVSYVGYETEELPVAVKQYVLVAKRLGYVGRAKEVIYNALNNAGITIPFPQCDVHLIKE